KSELEVGDEKNSSASDEHYNSIKQLQDAISGKGTYRLHIVGDARHQLARLGFIVIAETEMFKSSENGVAHIVGRSLAGPFAPISLCKGEAITHNGDPKQAERGEENNAQILDGYPLGNHQAQQLRAKEVCRRHDEQAQESSERRAPICP